MVVTLLEDLGIGHKRFVSRQDSQHSWNSSLKKPNKLVQVVQRDLERLSKNEHGPEMINTGATLTTSLALLEIPIGQGPQGSAVFTGGHWEVGVGVRPDVGPLRQLVDEDEGRAARHGRRGRAREVQKYLEFDTFNIEKI